MNRWPIVLAGVLWLAGPARAVAQGLSGVPAQGGVTYNGGNFMPSTPGPGPILGETSLSPAQLAAQCNNCHDADGVLQQFLRSKGESHAVPPPLVGMPADQIVARVKAFRGDENQAAAMHRVVKQYTERQIREVASYVSGQPAVR